MTGRRKWALGGAATILVAVVALAALRRGDELRYLGSPVQRGEVRDVVDATGTVNAVVTVQVGSQVSGIIAKLYADFNSRVRRGEVIALIDSSLFHGALLQALGDQRNAEANVTVAEANLAKANAVLVQAQADYHRVDTMVQAGVETQQTLDLAKATYASARAAVDAAVAGVAQARAQVDQKRAAVEVARINIDHTVIRSPIDGIVVARNVDVGQTVAASLQAPTIFTIAQDLTRMQVYANADESDVGRIKVGAPVTFKVDAYPKDVFMGVVSQLRMNPTTIQNVVTYNAIVDFSNPDLKLFPGMTAYVTIPVATAEDALKVPNAALRYRPSLSPEVVQALYTRYGIEAGRSDSAGDDSGARGPRGPARGRGAHAQTVVVWKLVGDRAIEPVEIALGITDHAFTEVMSVVKGTLRPGDEVVTAAVTSRASLPGARGFGR
jgi:HlyD family secretion protein